MYKETGMDIGAGEGGGGGFLLTAKGLTRFMEVTPFCIIWLLGLTLQEELEYLKTRALSGTVSERESCAT